MEKTAIRRAGRNPLAWPARLQNMSVREQITFTCGVLMAVLILSGAILGTVSYETTQDYHASMQTVSDIYALNNALEVWDAVMEKYILNATELEREECEIQWEAIGQLLNGLYTGGQESNSLALANIRSIYEYTRADMKDMLAADSNAERMDCYAALSARKTGLLFLSDQMLRSHIETNVKSYPQIISRNLSALAIFFAILAVSAVLLIVCGVRMIQAVCTPIDLLVADAQKIAAGHYDTPAVAILNDDEMGYLSRVFNDMKKQVSNNFKNMERILELQNLLQDAELKALQAQINPHFLFNVLSVAEEAALCENAGQTVEVIENISYMLQYSLKCTKQDTKLQEELRMVQAYLFLQEKRFGDRIRLEFSAERDLPSLPIPGMTLQPMVENAIRHGVEKMERGGVVQVRIQRRPGHIEMTIADNGCGIEPELLAAIRRKESIQSRSSMGGIGLVNVCRRMEIFYKQTGLFEIKSAPGRGTTVILRYPLTESEGSDV